ncbi:D-serine/D-alanine/glycine transporter [Methylobacterium brachythecii]|uniref:D-serine/D-alanine/glycine transporter n=1 Tax=Methylobacterium brachythecii TaxID=1176177 RepID=A0A7W6ANU3_9HYPH|nr:D-serine/D-alanine/glycine transporter [Methylobacterium brachythecii]MBB3904694.1 D-serine/D-alanine/glycine transporter [Methylobacterium brachythecii]GLS46804.1 D-serine/D-alanine/glycine transporter [Methylobacterium brachythecii]
MAGTGRGLERSLENRHIQMMALGGAIGTGLFMGSGKTISVAGPSILLVYLIIGVMLFFVMRALGELLLSNLAYKSFTDFADDLLGPWAGFFVGWTYWFCWIVTAIAEVVAIAAYAKFFFPLMPSWIPALACVGLLLGLNLVNVRAFGELEFWFAMIKIVAILALIFVGIALVATGFTAPSGAKADLANIARDGLFPTGLWGFFAGFQIAVFAFVGIELVGTTAAETRDPEKTLPRAINAIPIRILLFYLGALAVIMAVTPWKTLSADKSPFVELFVLAGLPAAAAFVNLVVMSSAASSANSGIFSTSRMLYGLADKGDAPAAFGRLSAQRVPSIGLYFTGFCLLGGVLLVYLVPDLGEAFTLVTTLSAVLFMFVWAMILFSYLAYRKNRPELHVRSAYKMPAGVLMCWVCLAFFAFIIVLLTFEADTRLALMASPVWFAILGIAWMVLRGRRTVAA